MRRGRLALGAVLVLLVLVVATLIQLVPLVTAGQAASVALKFQAGPTMSGWKADWERLVFEGDAPHSRIAVPGGRSSPESGPDCLGPAIPAIGYCLPYPIWNVHLVGPRSGTDCSESLVSVDGRAARVDYAQSQSGPCGSLVPLS
jgi:hypothetical protein